MPEKESYTYITTTDALKAFCTPPEGKTCVTIDTEFVRETTYFPQLCLIQLAWSQDNIALIDPINNKGITLEPLLNLLTNKNITKIFHAASQDLEILAQLMDGDIPAPIFDTQVAAMFCGHGDQISYSRLVEHYCGLELNKDSQYTNWARRPLTPKQMSYAAADVSHLHAVYRGLINDLTKAKRLEWAYEEMATLFQADKYMPKPADAWKKVKGKFKTPLSLALLQGVAQWREELAIQKNVPRQRVLKDTTLAEIALHPPKNPQSFSEYRGKDAKQHVNTILTICQKIKELPSDRLPIPKKPKPLTDRQSNVLDILKLTLKLCSRNHTIVPRLIAGSSELEALARGSKTADTLKGWRYDLFGKQAESILKGTQAISLDSSGNLIFIKT